MGAGLLPEGVRSSEPGAGQCGELSAVNTIRGWTVMHSMGKHTESESFGFLVSNAPGLLDTGLVIAGVRCGATGVLNCENETDAQAVRGAVSRIGRMVRRPMAIK